MTDNDMRDELYNAVYENFVGPIDPEDTGLTKRYPLGNAGYAAGVLYPVGSSFSETPDHDDSDARQSTDNPQNNASDADEIVAPDELEPQSSDLSDYEEPISLSNSNFQSAISLTVRIPDGSSLRIEVHAATYKEEKSDKTNYRRRPITWNCTVRIPSSNNPREQIGVPETNLELVTVYRYRPDDYSTVLSIALRNTNRASNSGRSGLGKHYFQCSLAVSSSSAFLPVELQRPDDYQMTEEELSDYLIYSPVKNYALGHGCAADWDSGPAAPETVRTRILPLEEVRPTLSTIEELSGVRFEMRSFAEESNWEETRAALSALCDAYERWISDTSDTVQDLHDWRLKPATANLDKCRACLRRMREGLDLLEVDRVVRSAFIMANEAMYEQYLHYSVASKTADSLEAAAAKPRDWRPFQIAFILLNITSMSKPESDDRSLLDLIWFPTGGGKTEAYLGLTAFTLILERLNGEKCDGTSVIMRYTLRLLTKQQFSRAAALICALEVMRARNPNRLGSKRFSIGLWVGRSTTPNTWEQALQLYGDLRRGIEPEQDKGSLPILQCPWCGEPMGQATKDAAGYIKTRKRDSTGKRTDYLRFFCPNHQCHFHQGDDSLPLLVVDEEIYENPPSLLLGTVDKFAMIPYRKESFRLFGIGDGGERFHTPKLIIQDELHLISGPLGSMVACYETLIDALCSYGSTGASPKIIASTATVSRAKEQCNQIFACAMDSVCQFPPSGIRYDDSFFARIDHGGDGRRYAGLYAPSITAATASIRLYTELLWEPCTWQVDDDVIDPYWTVTGYYNTTRELGQALTWTVADIPERLLEKRRANPVEKPRYLNRTLELTGRKSASDVQDGLERLSAKHATNGGHDRSIDLCLATNMISVGLDVGRLGTMVVAGQPKETSEYIQATSRVGRSDNHGIVFTAYNASKPRDRSHYENFKNYHQSFYKHVEPSSATAFCQQVRDRALPAILVALYRMQNPSLASPNNPQLRAIETAKQIILTRINSIDPNEVKDAEADLDYCIQQWVNEGYDVWYDLGFPQPDTPTPLIHPVGVINPVWGNAGFDAPTAMRTVDGDCQVAVLQRRNDGEADDV